MRKRDNMKANIKSKLEKLYALYNDDAAKATEESAAALAKIKALCKRHKVNFEDFMASMGHEEAKEETKPEPKVFVFKSRRNCIIELIREGCWDKRSIAEAVVFLSKGRYTNIKANLKAVSGTIYDLNAHGKGFIRTCPVDGRIVFD